MPIHALPVHAEVASVYRTHNDSAEPVRVKYDDHYILTSHVGGRSSQQWEGKTPIERYWRRGSVAFLPRNSELMSYTGGKYRGVAVRLSDNLFLRAAADHIDYGRIDFRFTDITNKATQTLTNALHSIAMMESVAHWPLLVETAALSLTVSAIAAISPQATTAFEEKPYGLDAVRKKRVLAYIDANMHRQMTLAELSDVAGLSMFHFTRQFKTRLGMSPLSYLANMRVDLAKTKLRASGAPLAQVALNCGFASQSHFNTVFKTVTGTTPGMYRKSVASP